MATMYYTKAEDVLDPDVEQDMQGTIDLREKMAFKEKVELKGQVESKSKIALKGKMAIKDKVDLSALLGTWVNTNSLAKGIVKVVLSASDDALTVHVFGAGEPSPYDWKEAPGAVYTDGVGAKQATSYTASYDLGFMDVHLQTYLAKGVLVIASFTKFKDGSGRANTFTKEFFYRK